jgi:hypothetical protein
MRHFWRLAAAPPANEKFTVRRRPIMCRPFWPASPKAADIRIMYCCPWRLIINKYGRFL